MLLGDPVEPPGEHGELAGERHLHHEPLALVDVIGEATLDPREAGVRVGERGPRAGVHEDRADRVQEVVARRARGGPVRPEALFTHEDLLHHHVEVAGQPPQVVGRVEQPVHVVDPQAGDDALAGEAEGERVERLEHRRVLHPHRRELVDVEEAPVVDLVGGHPPVAEAVTLVGEQRLEPVEACRVARAAVEVFERAVDRLPDGGGSARRRSPSRRLITSFSRCRSCTSDGSRSVAAGRWAIAVRMLSSSTRSGSSAARSASKRGANGLQDHRPALGGEGQRCS